MVDRYTWLSIETSNSFIDPIRWSQMTPDLEKYEMEKGVAESSDIHAPDKQAGSTPVSTLYGALSGQHKLPLDYCGRPLDHKELGIGHHEQSPNLNNLVSHPSYGPLIVERQAASLTMFNEDPYVDARSLFYDQVAWNMDPAMFHQSQQ